MVQGILQASANGDSLTTGTGWKTLLQLVAGANHGVRPTEISVSFKGVTNTHAPIEVQLLRQTTAGTMTARTPNKANDSNGDTLDTSGQYNATAEPTAGEVLRTWNVHPQTGFIYTVPDIAWFGVGAGDRLGLRVYSGNDIGVSAYIQFEE